MRACGSADGPEARRRRNAPPRGVVVLRIGVVNRPSSIAARVRSHPHRPVVSEEGQLSRPARNLGPCGSDGRVAKLVVGLPPQP